MIRRAFLIILTFIFLAALTAAARGQALEVFPRCVELEVRTTGMENFESSRDFLQIRIDTSQLSGRKWRLWIQTAVPPESLGRRYRPEALSWTARPPFISGRLLSNDKVLVGEGPINGQIFEGRLIWKVNEAPLQASRYRGRIVLILEELP